MVSNLLKLLRVFFILIEIFNVANKNLRIYNNKIYFISEFYLTIYLIVSFFISYFYKTKSILSLLNNLLDYVLLILIFIRCHSYLDDFIRISAMFFLTIILLNFLSVILFPNGLYISIISSSGNSHEMYFYSIANQFGKFLLPGLSIILFYSEKKNKKVLSFFSLFLVIMTYIITESSSGLISSFVFAILFGLFRLNLAKKWMNSKNLLLIIVLFYMSLLLGLGLLYENEFISKFLYALVKKDLTFSNRVYIWSNAFEMIRQKLLFGYGQISGGYVQVGLKRFDPHNILLYILLESGIIGLIPLLIFLLISCNKNDFTLKFSENGILLSIGLFSTLLYFSMESGSLIPFMFLLLIMDKNFEPYYSLARN